jgi:fumarylpyruvate hydrolase
MATNKRRELLQAAAAIAAGGATVSAQVKQNANLNRMIWSVAERVSKLSDAFELMPGDIIYSGTPENVGPVVKGDVMDAHIDGLPDIRVRVV